MVAEYRRRLVPEEVACKSLEEYCAFLKQDEMRKGNASVSDAKVAVR